MIIVIKLLIYCRVDASGAPVVPLQDVCVLTER